MYVQHRFYLDHRIQDYLKSIPTKFGYDGFGEIVFYRTYSRIKKDGGQEDWSDCVIRVTEGTYSIRKDFYLKNRIPWDDEAWQKHAASFAEYMLLMKWLPPGRGLWAMGTDFVYERGSMCLYNCGYVDLKAQSFSEDIGWLMDSLMLGVGVGFGPLRDSFKLQKPAQGTYDFIIPDTREGWVEIVTRTLDAYINGTQLPYAIYDQVRPEGLPIKGFGGLSSGPAPLKELVESIKIECELFLDGERDVVEFKTNIANMVGCCVVAGNVRRSAEIACGLVRDEVFLNLKDYTKYPYRAKFGWMSNNSAILDEDEDFDCLGEIAKRVIANGEPGVINRRNLKYGRIGKSVGVRLDHAVGFNPCGEVNLESDETCDLVETLPTMCDGPDDWYKACEYGTFYASTVNLLPTHQPRTNRVVARNRRIGVGIIDFTGWKHHYGVHSVTKWLRAGYQVVEETNRALNAEAGIPESIRKTVIKPGGTTPKLAGKTSGCGYPTFKYTIRRMRIAQNSPIHSLLVEAGYDYEPDVVSAGTDVFSFPIIQGPAKTAEQVTLWEQANNLVLLQREWADNAVSNTLYFRPKWMLIEHVFEEAKAADLVYQHIGFNLGKKDEYVVPEQIKVMVKRDNGKVVEAKIYEYNPRHEEDDIEAVLSSIIPLCKSVSLLPHTPQGVYKQMPEEGITKEQYEAMKARIKPIDWDQFSGSDGTDERYCTGDACEVLK